jgi:hypothetical protein
VSNEQKVRKDIAMALRWLQKISNESLTKQGRLKRTFKTADVKKILRDVVIQETLLRCAATDLGYDIRKILKGDFS